MNSHVSHRFRDGVGIHTVHTKGGRRQIDTQTLPQMAQSSLSIHRMKDQQGRLVINQSVVDVIIKLYKLRTNLIS